MGGAAAEVSDATTEILLESAYFEPSGIAKTSKRLGLRSEASARFERGVDPTTSRPARRPAMELLRDGRGREAGRRRDRRVPEADRAGARDGSHRAREPAAGTELSDRRRAAACSRRSASSSTGGIAIVPTWRPDIEREIDLVEEVARRIGLDQHQRTVPSNPEKIGALTTVQRERRAVADVLVGAGYDEVVHAAAARGGRPRARRRRDRRSVIEVENPLRAEESVLRPALLPGLLRAVAHNAAHGNTDVALFELGRVFAPPARGRRCRSSDCTSRRSRSGRIVRTPYEPDRDVTAHDVDRGRRSARAGAASGDWRAGRGVAARVPSRPRREHRGRRGRGRHGRRDRCRRRRRARADRAGRRVRARRRRVARGGSRAASRAGRSRAIPARRSTSRSSSPTMSRPATVLRTLRRAAATCSSRFALFDVFRSEALGAGQGEPRVRAQVPRTRSHADRRRSRRAAPAVHRRGRLRRSRPSCGDERRAVLAPDPSPLRRGRRPGRRVQRPLAHLLRRDVHAIRRSRGDSAATTGSTSST